MNEQFLEPFASSAADWDRSVKAVQGLLRTMPTGQVNILHEGSVQPLCSLHEFRVAYSYMTGAMALWAVDQYSKESLWSCATQYTHADYRVQFNRRDILEALGQPGCVLLGLVAMDCWGRAVHEEVFRQGKRAFLSSAFQRMGEFCFATDMNPLSSLSTHARPALASMLELGLDRALHVRGELWDEPLLRRVLAAIRNSGHFICTAH